MSSEQHSDHIDIIDDLDTEVHQILKKDYVKTT